MSNMFDAMKMLGKLGEIKQKAKLVKEKLKSIEITESSEDQLVKVVMTADKSIKRIEINENLLNLQAKNDLEEKIVEALNIGYKSAEKRSQEELKENLKDSLPDIPGLDLENLPI